MKAWDAKLSSLVNLSFTVCKSTAQIRLAPCQHHARMHRAMSVALNGTMLTAEGAEGAI